MESAHDTEEWETLVAESARLGMALGRWQNALDAYKARRDGMTEEQTRAAEREAVERHIRYKASVRELRQEVADGMLAALEGGADPDYRTLYLAVVRKPMPEVAYHTSPREFRDTIKAEGLKKALPSDGPWNINAHGQPRAVYVGPEPDLIGKWATTDEWDVWEVHTGGTEWIHDPINEGCWAILEDIPPHRVVLFERVPA